MSDRRIAIIVSIIILAFLFYLAVLTESSADDMLWDDNPIGGGEHTPQVYDVYKWSVEHGRQHQNHIEKDPFSDRWIIYKGHGAERAGYIEKDPFTGENIFYDNEGRRQVGSGGNQK